MSKFLTWNVGGIHSNTTTPGTVGKRDAAMAEIRRIGADVVCLQEVHCPNSDTAFQWQGEWGGLVWYTEKSSSRGGAAVLFKPGFVPQNIRVDFDMREDWEGAWVRVRYEWKGTEFTVVSVYVPSEMYERKRFLKDEMSKILVGPNLILGGDLNCVLNAALDVSSTRQDPSALGGRKHLMQAKNQAQIVDAFRDLYPSRKMFTRVGWATGAGRRQSPARLDRHLVSEEIMPWVRKVHKVVTPHSDHDLVVMVVDSGNGLSRGPGYWKLNVSLMDEEGGRGMRALWREWQEGKLAHPGGVSVWMAEGLERVRKYFQSLGKQRAKERRKKERDLRNQVTIIDKMVEDDPDNESLTQALHKVKTQLRDA